MSTRSSRTANSAPRTVVFAWFGSVGSTMRRRSVSMSRNVFLTSARIQEFSMSARNFFHALVSGLSAYTSSVAEEASAADMAEELPTRSPSQVACGLPTAFSVVVGLPEASCSGGTVFFVLPSGWW